MSFLQPGSEHRHGRGRQRRDPLLAALAEAAHVGTAAEHHVLASQPDQLETRRPVSIATSSRAWSRRPIQRERSGLAKEGVDLVLAQELHDGALGALGRYGKDARDEGGVLGMAETAKRNMECSAARRALRVRTALARSVSR